MYRASQQQKKAFSKHHMCTYRGGNSSAPVSHIWTHYTCCLSFLLVVQVYPSRCFWNSFPRQHYSSRQILKLVLNSLQRVVLVKNLSRKKQADVTLFLAVKKKTCNMESNRITNALRILLIILQSLLSSLFFQVRLQYFHCNGILKNREKKSTKVR